MREKVNRLARGILNEDLPVLSVSPEQIRAEVRCGEVLKVLLQADSLNGVHLKGLAWSDSIRVRVLRSSFGGKRNQIALEADGRNLPAGSRIEGKITLVTNAGERTVPFLFTAAGGAAGNTLSSLKTIEDFALIAKAEPESALRIFEYRDFVSAPFMQDLKLRSLYAAFRSGPDRASAMEEFLVAAGAKRPALVRNETGRCEMICGASSGTAGVSGAAGISTTAGSSGASAAAESGNEGSITLVRAREGYFSLAVRAEGAFIKLPKRSVTPADFSGSSCIYRFRVVPARLHEGRNEGNITFYSQTVSFQVPVTVWRAEASTDAAARKERLEKRKHYADYEALRVQYELSGRTDSTLPPRMREALSKAGAGEEGAFLLQLLDAEAAFFAGSQDSCRELLEKAGPAVKADRQNRMYEYLMFEAVRALLPEEAERRESTSLLLGKYLEEERMYGLLPRYLALRPEFTEKDAASLKLFLHEEYLNGNRSPFLFAAFASLYERHPDLISGLDVEELSVLRFSLEHGLPGREAAAAYTVRAGELKQFTDLHCRLLPELYEREPSRELLTAVCRSLIRRDQRTPAAHAWYLRGIKADIRLTGLCEYVVYSVPGEQKTQLPREVLLYFAYDNRLDDRSRAVLYENICRFRKKEPSLWEEYRKQLMPFTLEQLLKGRVNRHLAVLYREVLCREIIDRRLAAVLPAVLNSRRVRTDSEGMRSVVMVSPQLKEEEKFRLEKQTAYIPVQAEDTVFLFEDSYGNRFADVSWKEEEVCAMPDLLQYCEELVPEGRSQVLKRLNRILRQAEQAPGTVLSAAELKTMMNAAEDEKLSEAFTGRILNVLLLHPKDCASFLADCPPERFTPEKRKELLGIFIESGNLERAWDLMKEYLMEDCPAEALKTLCSGMLLKEMFPEDSVLLKLCAKVFLAGRADPVILDYLCERWNGSTEDMYRLLMTASGSGCQTEDLEERLAGQMLFTGDTEHLKELFGRLKERGKGAELTLRACITELSAEYVLDGRDPGPDIFLYLETFAGVAPDKAKIPVIYRLALVRHISELKNPDAVQKDLAEQILPGLLDEGVSFPYYKNLAKFIPVPEEVLDKESVLFRGRRDLAYEIRMRILPEETEFRTERLQSMYPGLFVRQEILFDGESWEYEIREAGGSAVLKKGVLKSGAGEEGGAKQHSRFARLNGMTESLLKKDEKKLRAEMEAFAAQEDLAEELFPLR